MVVVFGMTTHRLRFALGAVAVLMLLTAPAADARPWPDFPVSRLVSGTPASSRDLLAEGSWIVVVVRPNCAPCQALMRRFDAEVVANHLPGQRVLVVFSGVSQAEAVAFRAVAPSLPEGSWYRDESGQAADLLRAGAVPAVFGVRRGDIAWSLRGAQFTDAFLRDLVLPWLR